VATLLEQVPAAAKFKSKLEALENDLSELRAENARLKEELSQYIEQWETLDGPQVDALQYLAVNERGYATGIAKSIAVNIQIAETSLVFLLKCAYVNEVKAGTAGGKSRQFCLSSKGVRYLRQRGLHK
jgi:hypothetical protein